MGLTIEATHSIVPGTTEPRSMHNPVNREHSDSDHDVSTHVSILRTQTNSYYHGYESPVDEFIVDDDNYESDSGWQHARGNRRHYHHGWNSRMSQNDYY